MMRLNPSLRYLLSFLIFLLPLFAALPEPSFSSNPPLGMGAPAPLMLETASKRLAFAPVNQVKQHTGYFEVALVSLSAALRLSVGRFLFLPRRDRRLLLLEYGRLQLEGG